MTRGGGGGGGQILGMMLKTPQTPPEGIKVLRVLVEEAPPIATELYLSITLDRGRAAHVVMASALGRDGHRGGRRRRIPRRSSANGPIRRSGSRRSRRASSRFGLGLAGDQFKSGVALIQSLFRAYLDRDARSPRSIRSSSPATAAFSPSTPS